MESSTAGIPETPVSASHSASSSSTLQFLGLLPPVCGTVLGKFPRHDIVFLRTILRLHACLNQTLKGSKVHLILCLELLHLLGEFCVS